MSAAAVDSREIILGGQRIAYTLRRSTRKTLGLSIDHRGLIVGVPLRVGLREAEAFIRSHAGWVVDKLQARLQRQPVAAFEPVDGAPIPFLGEAWRLRLGRGNNRVLWHEQGPDKVLELALRAGADARQLLLRGLQQRSLELFTHRVEEFCLRLGRPMPVVGLSNARTRWGSCSRRSGIRLNWRLIHLPTAQIDYVVAHELAHLVEMNHSARFWAVVARIMPDYEIHRSALREAGKILPLF